MPWTNEPMLTTAVQGLTAVTADAPSPGAGYSIYAIGGSDGTNPVADVQAYDTTTRTWSTVPAMPTSRLNLAAASLPGQVYAIGGSDGTGPLANHEVFNPAGGNWTALDSLPTARESLGAATGPNGLIYAIGGYDGDYLTVVEMFDPATGTWESLPGMPTARSALAVVTGPDGLIYAIGGQNESGVLTTVEVFDVALGTWSTATSLPSACWSLAAAVGPDGLIYAYGGLARDGFPLSAMYGYDLVTKTWTTQDAMLAPQAFLAGVTGPDGLIYAIGGQNFTEPALNTMEAFTTGTPLTSPDPYIGNGTYQTADIVLLDASNNPIPIGGAPGGVWDTLLAPNTNYGLQAIVYNDSTVPAAGTVVAFWHFPGGVGTSGALIDQQTVTIPANGSLVVTSASPFVSGPRGAHECAAVSIYCPDSLYFNVDPSTGTQVIDPTVAHPANSGHFGSAWRNTNSYSLSRGTGWVFPFHLSPLAEPLDVGLTARAAKVPAGWETREDVTAFRRALEFAGAANRVPLFLLPELREKLSRADLGLQLHDEDRIAKEAAAEEATSSRTVRAGAATAFYLSGTVPADAKKGDIYLVNVEAHYPATTSQQERSVGYLEVIYVR